MLAFDNSYSTLPDRFFARVKPTTVAAPRMIKFNHALAAELGIDPALDSDAGAAIFSGNAVPEGANPISMAYAGHQFGAFVPQLGDGRAILLGEIIDRNGVRRDIQLKGAGRTPYSRGGDGRAAIGPVLREYLVSEAMHALGIPTTRALAAVSTGDDVYRETALPGAVLTRVAASHIRVGTFQFFAARGDVEGVCDLCLSAGTSRCQVGQFARRRSEGVAISLAEADHGCTGSGRRSVRRSGQPGLLFLILPEGAGRQCAGEMQDETARAIRVEYHEGVA